MGVQARAYSPPKVAIRSPRRSLVVFLTLAGLAFGSLGCGGSASSTSSAAASAPTSWATQTEQLCREKLAAIAGLGYVHITDAGIARLGLPAVKRKLDHYLARLLAVLSDFARRQGRLSPPPSVRAPMAVATKVDLQSQAATLRLRRDVARAGSASALAAAFRVWIASSERLAARGDELARQLDLPDCRSGRATTSS